MKTLADECLDLLDGEPIPATALASKLGADRASVRDAIKKLAAEGRAQAFTKGQGAALHLAPLHYAGRICVICMAAFDPPASGAARKRPSKRQTCSRACAASLSWLKPGAREKKIAAIKAERQTERAKARLAEHDRRRWSKPEEHQKLSEQNRREWADPYKAAKRAVGIKKAHSTPEKRKFYSESRKKEWADPVERERRSKIIKEAKNKPEYKAKHREMMKARWRDPVMREKYTRANGYRNEKLAARWAQMREQTKNSPESVKVEELYLSGMSLDACAAALGKTRPWVVHRLKLRGVQRRPPRASGPSPETVRKRRLALAMERDGLPQSDIAARMGVKITTLRVVLHYARNDEAQQKGAA